MENISMTNGEYIKKLIEMEELLYEKFREAQQMKQIKIKKCYNVERLGVIIVNQKLEKSVIHFL